MNRAKISNRLVLEGYVSLIGYMVYVGVRHIPWDAFQCRFPRKPGVLISLIVVVLRPLTLAFLQCRDGARRFCTRLGRHHHLH